ncbi:sensor histidine kinase [Streptomyces rubiginosohelvolus]|uniref:sensor histidine kinase n=1 Tax=Streptomyces rubiginosohelvolus TaxID=67362 RepID=UPI003808B4FC
MDPTTAPLLSPKMQRLVAAAALIALALAWFADFALLFLPLPDGASSPSTAATSWIPVFVTGPLATLALPDYRWQLPLKRRVELVAVMSIALSCACLFVPQQGSGAGALETLALLLLIIRVVAEVHPTRTAAWMLALLVVAVLMLTLRGRRMETFLTGTYVLTMVVAVCVILGAALRVQEALRRRDVQEVRQAERLALARDLHDLVAHHMTGIIVQANAGRTVQATAPEKVGPILESIARAGTDTLDSMRRLVRVLREDDHAAVRPGPLLTELGDLTADFASQQPGGPSAQLEVTAAARNIRFSPEAESSVYRLAQEALTNVRRHAPGQGAVIQVDADAEWLHVRVTNSMARGRRATSPAGGRGGLGLIGLRERVEALDGVFRAGPDGEGRWRLTASLPRRPDQGEG